LVEMADSMITGGQLGGLLTFRSDALDSVQNDLGRVALGISVALNEQHVQGYDLSGVQGTNLFSVGTPKVIGNAGNDAAAGSPVAS
ncbi:FlgK family flagellar hook-associated protein, partial [Methylobacterium nigriterrae]|uniref:FlgK family flagellar hook-associated protein n=1 Tax=Methylobacterium nigriterrae TaxID=3127512 RepID=UPI0030135C25